MDARDTSEQFAEGESALVVVLVDFATGLCSELRRRAGLFHLYHMSAKHGSFTMCLRLVALRLPQCPFLVV